MRRKTAFKMAATGFLLLILSAVSAAPVFSAGKGVYNVHTDKKILGPNEAVQIAFQLSADARATVLVHSPDYEVVRHLLNGAGRPAGVNTVSWDGADDGGRAVPDEAYLFTVTATDEKGHQAVYDPTSITGGEVISVSLEETAPEGTGYRLYYTTPVPSRVNIRAGIHRGPLLSVIQNWAPKDAGGHSVWWDGLDATGSVRVMDQPGSHIYITGFRLPDNTIIVERGIGGYVGYQAGLSGKTDKNLPGMISAGKVRRGSLKRMASGVSSQYMIPRYRNVVPKFSVRKRGEKRTAALKDATEKVSGDFAMVIEVDPESLENFNNSRYEIVVFVDNIRRDEEEYAQSPYTYILNTRLLPNGEHSICINMAGLEGQVGSYLFNINVQN